MDIEPRKAIHTFKLAETVERYLACPCDELKQLGTLFLVKGADCAPEPLNLRGGGLIVVVFGMILPIIDVDIRKTRDKKFELLLIKDGDELRWDNIMETYRALVRH